MKKILLSLLAVAALASCSKMTVEYDTPQEIGFKAVAGNITKAPVDGTEFHTDLNLYVNAYTKDVENSATTPNYIYKGEFEHRTAKVWGGVTPYYWPNEKTLHFSGYSNSGTWSSAVDNPSYNPSTDALTITGYSPGVGTDEGANDLMWFPSTKYTNSAGYGKKTEFVPVNLYHTCAWITFIVQGDATTGGENSSYTITSLKMNGVDQTADVKCTGSKDLTTSTLSTHVVWTNNEDQTGNNTTYNVTLPTGGVALAETYTSESSKSPKNVETGSSDNAKTTTINEATTGGNIVVIPQKPGTIDLEWSYTSSAKGNISDSATGLDLKINDDADKNKWLPGVHYIYTITIKANEILVAPTPVRWDPTAEYTVTIE